VRKHYPDSPPNCICFAIRTREHSMFKARKKQLDRFEGIVARLTEESLPCNCRVETRFHGPNCLEAVLKGAVRDCPVHGIRELGFFMWTSQMFPLILEDNRFCPCAPHPWRSFLLSEGHHTWEGHHAARKACGELPRADNTHFQDDTRAINHLLDEHFATRQARIEMTGCQPASREEIRRLAWKRARNVNK
jgi:hypothetical protein